jgi:photosystem II stability/assembly factor-like uncharacterized protein
VQSPLAPRALVNGLARADARIVAVGQRGHVLLSDDAGKTWRQAEVPVSSDLVAVAFPTATQGWAVGHDGVVLHSADAGATWTRVLDGNSWAPRWSSTTSAKRRIGRRREGRRAGQGRRALRDAGAENPFSTSASRTRPAATGRRLRPDAPHRRRRRHWQPWLQPERTRKGLHLYAVRGVGGEVYAAGEQGLMLKLDRAAGRFCAAGLPYKGTLFGIVGNQRALVVHGLRGTVLRSTDQGRSWQRVATGCRSA